MNRLFLWISIPSENGEESTGGDIDCAVAVPVADVEEKGVPPGNSLVQLLLEPATSLDDHRRCEARLRLASYVTQEADVAVGVVAGDKVQEAVSIPVVSNCRGATYFACSHSPKQALGRGKMGLSLCSYVL